ncbi:hypothetical protein RchiOBHm_Chr2g0118091 [Rosa chinensis]|uniref:Uncharacterized protein n=1 Tax=Rosa chinensis TaxID=74649 RepID=A0A2P6RRN8_ROSCH|nr:hypothetical protein RchiOBHm_Chr2g0118091 [Rosa chinensis]
MPVISNCPCCRDQCDYTVSMAWKPILIKLKDLQKDPLHLTHLMVMAAGVYSNSLGYRVYWFQFSSYSFL